jgi:hypothetical protein
MAGKRGRGGASVRIVAKVVEVQLDRAVDEPGDGGWLHGALHERRAGLLKRAIRTWARRQVRPPKPNKART